MPACKNVFTDNVLMALQFAAQSSAADVPSGKSFLRHGLFAVFLVLGSYLLAQHNYLAFHTVAELSSIVIAAAVFVVAWHSYRFSGSESIVALGMAFFCAGILDLVHTLSYKGIEVFQLSDRANTATQLWIAARFLESLSLLAFAGLETRRFRRGVVLAGYAVATAGLLWSILSLDAFPDCFVEASGLTAFKIGSEYAICLILACALALLYRKRQALDPHVWKLLSGAIAAAILSELAFTLYVSVYGLSNLVGHLFKLVSFYLVYLALVRASLKRPYQTIFRQLKQSRDDLNRAQAVAHVGSWRLDVTRNSLEWSDENHRIFGIPKETRLTYETFLGTVHPEDREFVHKRWTSALQGEPYEIEHRIAVGEQIKWVREKAELEFGPAGELLGGFGTTQDITDLKEAEAALKRSIRRFEILSQTAGELLKSTEPQRRVEKLCREVMEHLDCHAFFNFLADEKTGRLHLNVCAGVPSDEAKRIEWLDYGVAVCGCAARDGYPIIAEHIPTTPDIRTELVKSYGIRAYACHPILSAGDKVIGTLSFGTRTRETFSPEDISLMRAVTDQVAVAMDRIRHEQSLRESEERLRLTLKGANAGVWERDISTGRIFWSPENYDLYGIEPKPDGLTYKDWAQRIRPEDRNTSEKIIADAIALKVAEFRVEFRIDHPRKGIRWLLSVGRAHQSADRVNRISGINLDITELKELEAALRHSEHALSEANQHLEAKVKDRTAALANTVDALKREIVQRRSAEEALSRFNKDLEAKTAQLRALAAALTLAEHRERDRISRILHDNLQQQLAVAKLTVSGLGPVTGDRGSALVRVAGLIEDAIATSRSLAAELSPPVLHRGSLAEAFVWLANWMSEKYQLEVELRMADNLFPIPHELKILLFESARELLFNAFKHAGTKRVNLSIQQGEHEIRVAVVDMGRGFDTATVNRPGGSGSGLGIFSIAERLSMVKGRLEISSTPGIGSQFVMIAPVTHPGSPPEVNAIEGMPVPKIRVLLADDHKILRDSIALVLTCEPDMEIVGSASTGKEAIELARKCSPDVILLDINMPGLNGIDAAKIIRRECPSVRIVGLSMLYAGGESAEQLKHAGAVAFVSKSASPQELLSVVRDCLSR
jgi:PAS domain S-box-containing protein